MAKKATTSRHRRAAPKSTRAETCAKSGSATRHSSAAAALFRTAADVSRLKLLERLADGEWCVTELAEAAGSGLSTVSQQLRMLRAERIVARRRAGKHIF